MNDRILAHLLTDTGVTDFESFVTNIVHVITRTVKHFRFGQETWRNFRSHVIHFNIEESLDHIQGQTFAPSWRTSQKNDLLFDLEHFLDNITLVYENSCGCDFVE
uniref:Uncharacterized protein n=1 Tax=Cacopsylla melanoneura TaxID=428564 RepID=A0A8D8PWH6_9HEMI